MTATETLSQTAYKLTPMTALLGVQMLCVAFGALVLVPLLTGLDPNVALFTAGVGTLLFQLLTRGQVPVFLASSFAFIAPIIYGTQTWGLPATLCGLAAAGVVYCILSAVVRIGGVQILHKLLPSVVIGPVIMVIGWPCSRRAFKSCRVILSGMGVSSGILRCPDSRQQGAGGQLDTMVPSTISRIVAGTGQPNRC